MSQPPETSIHRRKYLTSVGTVVAGVGLAGCGSPDNSTSDGGSTNQSPGGASNDQSQETGEAEIDFGEGELFFDDTKSPTQAVAEVPVENVGQGDSGEITVQIGWYDEEDNLLGNTDRRCRFLRAGETWLPQIAPTSIEAENINRIEVSGDFEPTKPPTPSGMTVSESTLVIDDIEPQIEGVVENNRDEELNYVLAVGRALDEQGRITTDGWADERDIAAGTNWRYTIRLAALRALDRVNEDTEYEVALLAP